MAQITGADIQAMVRHWLETPVNGYLGSGYGQDIKSLLMNPQAAGVADSFLAKLREDIPILQQLPPDSLNLYAVGTYPDKQTIVIEVGGTVIDLTNND